MESTSHPDESPQERDLFPPTQSRVRRWLDAGEVAALNHHVMDVYYEPLKRYLRGSRSYRLEAARQKFDERAGSEWIEEQLNGFFADRLDRREYLLGWGESGKRLNAYLRGGIWLFLKERYRDDRRLREVMAQDEAQLEKVTVPEAADRELDRAYVLQLARAAREQARLECERRGFGAHWHVLEQHLLEDVPHKALAAALGVRVDRAPVMQRTALAAFRRAFEDLVRRHAERPELFRRTIRHLLDALDLGLSASESS